MLLQQVSLKSTLGIISVISSDLKNNFLCIKTVVDTWKNTCVKLQDMKLFP